MPQQDAATHATGDVSADPVRPAGGNAAAPSGHPLAAAPPPGLREELGATRGAVTRLARAHVDLAKAEFGEIVGEIKRLAIAAGVAFGLLLFAGILVPVGTMLFLGEWLFGSLGWGVLLGTELCIALAVAAVLGVLGATRGQVFGAFLVAAIIGIIVGVVFGLDLTNQGWTRLGDNISNRFVPEVRPLVTAAAVLAAIFGILGLLVGLRAGGLGGGIGGLIGGAIVGAILGAFTAISWGPQAGAAAGVAVALIVWPLAVAAAAFRRGIDFEGLKNRLLPNETIATTRETIEWVRKQTPLGRKS